MTKAIVWSKDDCPYCRQAVALLKKEGVETEIRKIGVGWTKQQLLEAVPTARSVPQVFLDDNLIGGYTQLVAHFKQQREE